MTAEFLVLIVGTIGIGLLSPTRYIWLNVLLGAAWGGLVTILL